MTAPDKLFAWCFNPEEDGSWGDWGGYARHTHLVPLDEKERVLGAEYTRTASIPTDARMVSGLGRVQHVCTSIAAMTDTATDIVPRLYELTGTYGVADEAAAAIMRLRTALTASLAREAAASSRMPKNILVLAQGPTWSRFGHGGHEVLRTFKLYLNGVMLEHWRERTQEAFNYYTGKTFDRCMADRVLVYENACQTKCLRVKLRTA